MIDRKNNGGTTYLIPVFLFQKTGSRTQANAVLLDKQLATNLRG